MSKVAQLREQPKSLDYQPRTGNGFGGRGNDLGYGNNVKDWSIRSELLRTVCGWSTALADRLFIGGVRSTTFSDRAIKYLSEINGHRSEGSPQSQ